MNIYILSLLSSDVSITKHNIESLMLIYTFNLLLSWISFNIMGNNHKTYSILF